MNRRTALKTMTGMGLVIACSDSKNQSSDPFLTDIGVCTSVENSAILKKNGCTYIEESVSRFLMPLESDEKFLQVRENLIQHLDE